MPSPKPFPSVRCSARSKQTGEPCKKFARPGSVVCHNHGGSSPQAAKRAEQRVTLAAVLEANPVQEDEQPRTPAAVLLDHLRLLDGLARDAQRQVQAGEATAATVDRVVELSRLTCQVAKTALDSGAAEKLSARETRIAEEQAQVVVEAVKAVAEALAASVAPTDAVYRRSLAEWARKEVARRLRAAETLALDLTLEEVDAEIQRLTARLGGATVSAPPQPTPQRLAIEAPTPAPWRPDATTGGSGPDGAVAAAHAAVSEQLAEEPAPDVVADDVVIEAEIVEEDEPPAPKLRMGWTPPRQPNAWGRGQNPMTTRIG